VRLAREQLSPANVRALEAFTLLARRVVMDFNLAPLVFEALRFRLSPTDAVLLVESLDLIYAHRCPVKTNAHGSSQ
jgi:hypothetical protein